MKLLFFYGPPAAGKLTVAKELSKQTGYKIFHNHLTIDLIESLFDRGTKTFDEFVTKYRLELIEAAARENVKGLIFTYVYAGTKADDVFVKKIITIVQKHKGTVSFIQFLCPQNVLQKRINHVSRKKLSKIKTIKILNSVMKQYDLYQSVPYCDSFTVDTAKLSAKEAASSIQNYCKLL